MEDNNESNSYEIVVVVQERQRRQTRYVSNKSVGKMSARQQRLWHLNQQADKTKSHKSTDSARRFWIRFGPNSFFRDSAPPPNITFMFETSSCVDLVKCREGRAKEDGLASEIHGASFSLCCSLQRRLFWREQEEKGFLPRRFQGGFLSLASMSLSLSVDIDDNSDTISNLYQRYHYYFCSFSCNQYCFVIISAFGRK